MSSFAARLLACKHEDSAVGDLARDADGDPAFPRTGTAADVRAHLQRCNACPEAMEAFEAFCGRFVTVRKVPL